MHIAETKEQAAKDVEYGIRQWFDYFQHTAAFPQMSVGDADAVREMIDFVNDSGLGSIGTADMACEQIERLQKQSGGFGCYMTLAHEWANPEATQRSYELIAQRVFPEFQGQSSSTLDGQGAGQGGPGAAGRAQHAGRHRHDREAPEGAGRQGVSSSDTAGF